MSDAVGKPARLRLGVNIDHVATVRNARGGALPDPVRAALLAVAAGADGITAHLREDRRHIRDADMYRLAAELTKPLNFEMGATEEMIALAERLKPHAACLVPEKREERTTEGGLDVVGQEAHLSPAIARLKAAGCRVSLFIEPDEAPIAMSAKLGAPVIELHTGSWCHAVIDGHAAKAEAEFQRLANGAALGAKLTGGGNSAAAVGASRSARRSMRCARPSISAAGSTPRSLPPIARYGRRSPPTSIRASRCSPNAAA